MRRRLLAGLVLAGVVAMLLGQGAMALSLRVVEYELEQLGLATDAPTLLSYLREGLPEGLLRDGQTLPSNRRWSIYRDVVHALGNMKSHEAPPVLTGLLEEPLPPKLAADLERSVTGPFPDEEYELVHFQSWCARALGQIGDASAVPALTRYVKRLLPLMKIKAETSAYSAYTAAFDSVCIALGELGSAAGVAFTVAVLPDTPVDNYLPALTLRRLTGQPFGPQYGHPARVSRREYAKWEAWWEANKATYKIDPETIADTVSASGDIADMKTVRDYVHQAPLATRSTFATNGPEAVEWLTQHGAAHIKELAALVNDPDETVGVRNEAMVWYARFGGRKAMRTLTKYVRCEVPFDPEDKKLQDSMRDDAFLIIKETSPKLASRLGKELIEDGSSISGFRAFEALAAQDEDEAYRLAERHLFASEPYLSAAMVVTLMQRPEGVQKVIQSYALLGDYAKWKAVQRLGELPGPAGKEIFFEAVKSHDRSIAEAACRAITRFELYDALPQDSRQAMDDLTPRSGPRE